MAAIRLPTSTDAFEEQLMAPFIDPLTQCLYIDPVTDPHGHTFSNEFIVQWLSQNSTCPYTGTHLTVNELVKNRALAHSQEAFFNEENGPIVMLQRQVSVLSLENERLTQENTELRLENRELKVENQDLKNDMRALMATLSQTNANMLKALEDNEKKDKYNEALREDNAKLREDNEDLRKHNKKLEEDYQDVKEGQKILNKKIEDLKSNAPSKEDAKIVAVSQKSIKEINEKSSKEQQKEFEVKKSSPGDGCVMQSVKLFVRPVIWVAKTIF